MDSRKHIVFLAEHMSLGGAEVVLTQYLQYIDPNKYKISLIVRDDLGEKNYLLKRVPEHVETKIVFSSEDLKRFKNYKGLFSSYRRKRDYKKAVIAGFRNALKELAPVDLVIDFMPVLNRYIDHFKDYKMILWMHGQKVHMPKWERYKYFLRMRQYDRIVLICEEMRQQFIELFPSVQEKFEVIYNPFDFDRIRSMAEDESELTEQDRELLKKDYVISIGRLVPGKDFKTIIEAARLLKERGFSYIHYILGAGELFEELNRLVERYGIQDRVFLLGPKKNPYVWLKHSKLFVHSALREGLPTVIIEAMILNKPVIACACPTGPREILESGKAGWIYGVGDYHTLANSIETVIANQSLQKKYLERAEQRSMAFHRSNVMPKFYELMDRLST